MNKCPEYNKAQVDKNMSIILNSINRRVRRLDKLSREIMMLEKEIKLLKELRRK